MDIGCGNTILNYVEYKKLYRVDPILTTTDDYNICGTWNSILPLLVALDPDCIFLMDVVEHLPKLDAINLLKITQMYTKQIVVFTPLGFMEQNDGEWNTHRSGWVRSDFEDGWKTWVLPNFHKIDFNGNKLCKPVDALLAIYTK